MKLRTTTPNVGTTEIWDSEVMGEYYDRGEAPRWHEDEEGHRVAIFEQSVGEALAEKYDALEVADESATQLDAGEDDSSVSDSGGSDDENTDVDGSDSSTDADGDETADEQADDETAQGDADSAQATDDSA